MRSAECRVPNAECRMPNVRFMVSNVRPKSEVEALHEPTPLVAADVRRLTLPQPVLREKDQSLVTSAATLVGWVQGPNVRPEAGGRGSP